MRKVVGVEMVEQAVDDARVNATLNGKTLYTLYTYYSDLFRLGGGGGDQGISP